MESEHDIALHVLNYIKVYIPEAGLNMKVEKLTLNGVLTFYMNALYRK